MVHLTSICYQASNCKSKSVILTLNSRQAAGSHFYRILLKFIGKAKEQLIRTCITEPLAGNTLQKIRVIHKAQVHLLILNLFSGLYELFFDSRFSLFEVSIFTIGLQNEATKKYNQHQQRSDKRRYDNTSSVLQKIQHTKLKRRPFCRV